ncbi:MAG TPA: glutamate racemase [Methylophaga aminisulfidivorans]|uniref:Glutamate racemase n=2 Tax=root TaxID=1 RepID=A0A7C1W6K0_9GAMM|nr:glutamate racemase [Methylophaga aminisulfidivorans]
MSDPRPIGIFDSGIGGLAIAKQVRALMPNEDILYVADSFHAPYGEKSEEYIIKRSFAVTDFLLSKNVKAIIVACNTATLASIKRLRAHYDVPFIGVEPGVKPAALNTKTNVIGVLATSKTVTSEGFSSLAHHVADDIRVEVQACPDLVMLVEQLKLSKQECTAAIEKYVRPLLEKGADTLILGCTHFSHLKLLIEKHVGPDIMVISTESAVAKEVKRRLEVNNMINPAIKPGKTHLFSNAAMSKFNLQVKQLWGNTDDILPF